MSEDEVTDPTKFFNFLIIATSIYVIVMLIIIYYSLIAPIKTTPDKFSDEYIKQQQQTSIENYFKEKNKEPKSGNRFYNYAKNYSMKFTNYFKTTINWFYDNRNFFIVLFTGFGFSTLTLSWINYYESTTIKELKANGSDITQKKLKDKLKELKIDNTGKKKADDEKIDGRKAKKAKIMKDIENKYNGKNTQEDFEERIKLERKINKDINDYNDSAKGFNDGEAKNISEIINISLYDKIKIPFLWVTGLTILIILLLLITFTRFKLEYIQIIVNVLILIGLASLLYDYFEEFQTEIGIALIFFIVFTMLGGLIIGSIFAIIGYFAGYYLNLYLNQNKPEFPYYKHILNFINLAAGFLPCLFINFAIWIKEEYLKTSKNILILLGIEALLVAFKFLIPYIYSLFKKVFSPKENILLVNPVPLDRVHNLGLFLTNEDVKLYNTSKLDTSDKFFNYNYAIAFSLWIFPQPKSVSDAYTKSSNLINISDIVKVIHNNNTIEFWAATTVPGENPNRLIKLYEYKEFKYQKWNNIIINYQGGSIDIFINKSLKSSTPNITPLKNNNSAVIGDINGINGGIKNVSYFKKALSQQDINLKL
jgi:hypothetical protein